MDVDITKKIEIEIGDLYHLLVAECRYGYIRNNHLMPWAAYERVKKLIPEMYKVDKEYAIYTLKQICTECMDSELVYYIAREDENGNRKLTMEFIKWCLDYIRKHETDPRFKREKWKPYCHNIYERALVYEKLEPTKKETESK